VQALGRFGASGIRCLQVLAGGHVRILLVLVAEEGRVTVGMREAGMRVEAALTLASVLVTLHRDALIVLTAVTSSHFIVVNGRVCPA